MSASSPDAPIPSIEKDSSPSTMASIKETVANNASAAAEAVKNHPLTESLANGPVADSVKDQHAKTTADISNLAASRTTPADPAVTGQQLTHYHSFFNTLLSWENPRATGIAFASTIGFIFAARYLNVLRYTFKATWMTLGVTVLAEVAGKTLLGSGLTSSVRPRKYYTVPKESLTAALNDVHEFINFFVIESQRVVFAENVFVSSLAFLGSFLSYYLIKIVPFWGLTLISTCILFLAPLIYKTNQELIDSQLKQASDIVNQQTAQVKQLASHHAARATEAAGQYVGDYSAKAQGMMGRSVSPVAAKKPETAAYKSEDFPTAPQEEFKAPKAATGIHTESEKEPLIAM